MQANILSGSWQKPLRARHRSPETLHLQDGRGQNLNLRLLRPERSTWDAKSGWKLSIETREVSA